ncbi:MAG: uridine kinase [Candidatus Marinimicrobia bacterium]|nr:uridine kinase [Candidatus Neomarinimicrobiota bacterium]MCF7829261.1 uridine kinase [Candidatus Neomarinimicrobiota bacterium]MCF7881086.1 uridine kinase [Candidatus Neomarinimicrobiota bacterium]
MKKAILFGLAGGSGSGKTLVAKNLFRQIDSSKVSILEQDAYYKDLADIPKSARDERNFDHPEAFDWDLMKQNMADLLNGKTVEIPVYDYKTHTRSDRTRTISGHHIIVLEGILVLADPELREMMDIKAFVETDDDIRFIRRLQRDIRERGRSMESVIEQYQRSVRPMHLQFVEPTKRFADIIIPEGGHNTVAIDLLKTKITALIDQMDN